MTPNLNLAARRRAMTLLPGSALMALLALLPGCGPSEPDLPEFPDERTVYVEAKSIIPVPGDPERIRVWIPLPDDNEYQRVSGVQVSGPGTRIFTRDATGTTRLAAFQIKNYHKDEVEILMGFEVTRRERTAFDDDPAPAPAETLVPPGRTEALEPDRLVPADDEAIVALAAEQTEGARSDLEKLRRIYDWAVSNMTYDKSGEGWGRGDAVWACNAKRGNCTDFHSAMMAMARSQGIPARFVMGYPIPEDADEGEIGGYHCWSEFYVHDLGWVPVDASEAAKHPELREYYFGRLTPHRFSVSSGRDLMLQPTQEGGPINFLSKPYAEADGVPIEGISMSVRFATPDKLSKDATEESSEARPQTAPSGS